MPLPALARRDRLRRWVRRRRRPLAALLAGCGVLLALAGLRSPEVAPPSSATAASSSTRLAADQVAVPMLLASPVLTSALSVGDIVDVIGVGDGGAAQLLATRARIIEIPPGASGFGGSGSSLVIIATGPAEGLAVSAATAAGPVSFMIRERATSR